MSRPVILTVAFERPFSKFAPRGGVLMSQDRICFGVLSDPINMIREALDALPLIVPTVCHLSDVAQLIKRADGLMLPGGDANIQPALYKHDCCPKTEQVFDPNRDSLEMALLNEAYRQKKPVLGICRGMQMINVWRGGTLNQSYPVGHPLDHMASLHSLGRSDSEDQTHFLHLAEGAHLHKWLGGNAYKPLRVNTWHQQSVNTLGQGLVMEAQAPDNTIEAFRLDDPTTFMYGVQWHPDFDPNAPASAAVLKAFRSAVDKRRKILPF